MVERRRDHVELLLQPADADPEVDPPAGEVVEVDHLLGRVHGVPLRHEADAGAEPDPVGDGGQVGEGGERLEQPGVAAAGEAAVVGVGVLRLVLVEHHHVLGHPDRLEAAVLGLAAERAEDLGVGVAVAERGEQSDVHGRAMLSRVTPAPAALAAGALDTRAARDTGGRAVNQLEGRVAIITGAGRGIGREHALLFAAEGAKVVVNDLGGSAEGTGADATPAEEVVAEIKAAGGEAIANHDDVTDFDAAKRLVDSAVDTFGDLHVLVNNAGILRDRMLTNMTEEEWDAVIKVHLKGHFAPMRHAAAYWRERAKAGEPVSGSVINTSSTSGLFGNVGQTNYGAAKMGIAALTIIGAAELGRYGVRVNAIAPAARTRLTQDLGRGQLAARAGGRVRPDGPGQRLAVGGLPRHRGCPITGRSFLVFGGNVELFQPFAIVDKIEKDGRWSLEELAEQGPRLGEFKFDLGSPFARMS